VHFGEYVLHGLVKLSRLYVAGLLLQFFDLALNIDQIAHVLSPDDLNE
jgi:hypothetical protein